MVDSNSNIDRITELSTSHYVFISFRTAGKYHGSRTNKLLTSSCCRQVLFHCGIANNDETPFLPVTCRRCEPCCLEEANNHFFRDIFILKCPYTFSCNDSFVYIHSDLLRIQPLPVDTHNYSYLVTPEEVIFNNYFLLTGERIAALLCKRGLPAGSSVL